MLSYQLLNSVLLLTEMFCINNFVAFKLPILCQKQSVIEYAKFNTSQGSIPRGLLEACIDPLVPTEVDNYQHLKLLLTIYHDLHHNNKLFVKNADLTTIKYERVLKEASKYLTYQDSMYISVLLKLTTISETHRGRTINRACSKLQSVIM